MDREDLGIQPAITGREAVFEEFYRSERSVTLAVVLALRGPRAGAEEVVQEAFVKAMSRWDEVSRMSRPDLWVRRVALNLATSRLRRLSAETRAVARLAARTTESEMMDAIDSDFWRLVRALPRRQQQAVVLRYAGDLSVEEVAAVMRCAEGTVKSHLHAARKTLESTLGGTRE